MNARDSWIVANGAPSRLQNSSQNFLHMYKGGYYCCRSLNVYPQLAKEKGREEVSTYAALYLAAGTHPDASFTPLSTCLPVYSMYTPASQASKGRAPGKEEEANNYFHSIPAHIPALDGESLLWAPPLSSFYVSTVLFCGHERPERHHKPSPVICQRPLFVNCPFTGRRAPPHISPGLGSSTCAPCSSAPVQLLAHLLRICR